MLSCHSRCAYSISDVYLMFPSKVAICFYTLAIPLPLSLFSTDFKEKGQHPMILIDFHELQIDCLSGFQTSIPAIHCLIVFKLWTA